MSETSGDHAQLRVVDGERADHALKASETRYRRLFEAARDGILILDAGTGRIVDVNPFLVELTGFSHEEFLDRHLWEIGPFKDIAASKDAFAELQTEKYVRYEDLPLRTSDGRKICVEFVSNVYLVDGKKVIQCNIRDITDRKQAESALLKEKDFNQSLIDTAQTIILVLDPQGRIVQFNHYLEELTGYRLDEVRGKDWFETFLPAEDRTGISKLFQTALSGVRTIENINSIVTKNGEERLVEWYDKTLEDKSGNVTGVLSTGRDITESRRADEALHQSEERFRILFEQAADIILLMEIMPDGIPVIRDANPATFTLLGYQRAELLDQPVSFLEVAPDAPELVQGRRQRILSGKGTTFEATHRCKDGTIREFECSVTEMQIGSKIFAMSVERDITERKRAEETLRASESEFRTLAEAMPQIVWITRPDGWNIFFNQQWMDYTGLSLEESQGHGWNKPFHPDDQQRAWDAWNKATSENGTYSIESRLRRADGAYRWWLVRGVPLMDAAGKIIKWYGTCTDIHDLKMAEAEREQLEEQLRVSQRMESIGSLAGGIAHDFNNLLSVILSYTDFAMDGARDIEPLKSDLLEVKKAGERAAALTSQLLAFSRKQVLQPVPLDLNRVAAGVETMLRRILGEDIDLMQRLAPDLGLVRADPGQIEQVLMNLVVNARDAMPRGGRLTIETSNVELDEEYAARHAAVEPGSYVMLAVTDTGCGMDARTRERLFEPFFTTKEKGKGTGLGLSTVYGIVKQSGGDIRVYSEPGQGTGFKIYLPRELSMTAAVPKASTPPKSATGTETVLVVEDEEALREVARRTLEAAGYTVLAASCGDEALEICAAHRGGIHLLVTDVVMPRMGGRVLAERLVETRPSLRVLYMSGYTDNAVVHHGVLDAGTHFLGKPFTSADLARRVREVLDEAPGVAPADPRGGTEDAGG